MKMKAFFAFVLLSVAVQAQLINTQNVPNVNIQRLRNDAFNVVVRFQNEGQALNVASQNHFFSISEAQSGIVRVALAEGSGIAQGDNSTISISLSPAQLASLTKDSYQYRLYTSLNDAETTKMYGTLWLVRGTLNNTGATLNTPIIVINYRQNVGIASNVDPPTTGNIVETDPTVSPAAKVITNSNVIAWNSAASTIGNKVDKVTGKALSTNDYTDTDKANVAASVLVRHSHTNKALLDTYAQTEANIANAVQKAHEHLNKSILDATTAPYTSAEKTKLGTVQTGATANSTDAQLRDRTTHTGLQGIATITNLQDSLGKKVNNTDTRLSNARTPVAHNQGISTITNLQDSLSKKVNNIDTRLSDARTPVAHNQGIATITNLQDSLGKKVNNTDTRLSNARTPVAHNQGISTITNLQDSLSKKANIGQIDYQGEVATDMFLVNTSTKIVLRIWLGSGQSEYRDGPASRDMFVNVDANILAMPNDYIQVYINTSETSGYCYNVTTAGPTGPVTVKKSYPFKYKLWTSEIYKTNKKLILTNLDSLKAPFSQHKSCTYNRPYYQYELTTIAPYFPLYTAAWASCDRGQIGEVLHNTHLSRQDNTHTERWAHELVATNATPAESPPWVGSRSKIHQYFSTFQPS